ncbi:type I-E CRISPR-associated protein Cse2/CasB [Corynebacterium gottingense]|uniref:Type I-E CRISPR-associated protein Cse2/CasB n=1 Tax=Corynebacterium gottingense TaxID=2041036 RepID=A0ABX9UHP2_9CORY|nr:type I-E CRISPR-associated protein Cse2/CasB [Corynebacterium gottingense]RMD18345.1 type I-E CRISPR-associated protein Cse2/CasB [Corynebacterium gottingense]WJZ14184.1 CRISPR-associated protein Cse2 [Corynebacterium gottingense]
MTETMLRKSVGMTVSSLQRNYLDRSQTALGAEARGTLANLRKYAGRPVGSDPLALQEVLLLLHPQLSEGELGKGAAPSPSEQAAYTALCLFGLHMQSSTQPMHVTEQTFGFACGRLHRLSDSKSIKSRFDAMLVSREEASRGVHLRSLVSLLRSRHIPFDYGRFAGDLRNLQNPQYRDGVLLRWGRDFAIGTTRGDAAETNEAAENQNTDS